MDFELIGELSEIETIAVNLSIREVDSLKSSYGGRRWRKLKGIGLVRLVNENSKRKIKIKRFLD